MSPSSVVFVFVAGCLLSLTSAAEFKTSPEALTAKINAARALQDGFQAVDLSKLTPEQRQLLALRVELVRRRRAEMAAAAAHETAGAAHSATPGSTNNDDLDGQNTYGFGAAALPFLGLYGLGLGGLGVGFGPLAYAGLFG